MKKNIVQLASKLIFHLISGNLKPITNHTQKIFYCTICHFQPNILTKNENELSVSSKFDVKEQVFYNPLFVISQEDEIHFLYKTYSEQDFFVNSIWISPNGIIVHVTRNSLVNATTGYLLEKFPLKPCKIPTTQWVKIKDSVLQPREARLFASTYLFFLSNQVNLLI